MTWYGPRAPTRSPSCRVRSARTSSSSTRGESAWSFLLQPQGKVDAWFRVPAHRQRRPRARRRRRLGRKPSSPASSASSSARGASWTLERLGARPGGPTATTSTADVEPDGRTSTESDLFGDALWVPLEAPGETRSERSYEALRINHGVPAMGAGRTSRGHDPAEAGQWVVDASVSFTKGCFTGQELVAAHRQPRRQRAPKNLRTPRRRRTSAARRAPS